MSIINGFLNQPRALVVEDDISTLELLREILSSQGFLVVTATEGESASALFQRESFHCILLDLHIPGLDGLELAGRIRKSTTNKSALVVMITGNEDRKTMEKAFAVGVSLFLHKPIDRRQLLNLLGMVRAGNRLQAAAKRRLA